MSNAKYLRKMLKEKGLLIAPGVYDALTARVARHCGFGLIYMTGFATSASYGYPDIGLLTMTEMLDNVRRISDAVDIPLIADADTGYGNSLNVFRSVREYEKAGAAAIQLEDQSWPKRCGHMDGKQVIDAAEMVGKVKAAVDARRDPDTVLIIRTDALAVHGFDEAIKRGEMYADAGADVVFIEMSSADERMSEIPAHFSKPCVINMSFGGLDLGFKDLEEMGYAIALYPVATMIGAIEGSFAMCKSLLEEGKQKGPQDILFPFDQFYQLLGLDKFKELENRFS